MQFLALQGNWTGTVDMPNEKSFEIFKSGDI
jgi:hypothetical protein